MAYGLAGDVKIGESEDKVLFDFESEIVHSIDRIGRKTVWSNYLSALASTLERDINDLRARSGQTLANEMSTTISLGGFFERSQKLGHIRFEHGIHSTVAKVETYPDGFSFPIGTEKLFELMNDGDERFAKYRKPPRTGLTSLVAGIERVRNDIIVHYDTEAIKIDETIVWRIGGRVQIATITLSDGFQWVPGFEPVHLAP